MIITIKLRAGYSKEKIEDFGAHRYLVQVTETEESAIISKLTYLFSKYFGVPQKNVQIKSINKDEWVIDIK